MIDNNLKVKVKTSMARSLPVERIYCHRMWGQLSTTCSNILKLPNGEHLVAIDHNQLRTMTSETVDTIDWSHPPPSWAAHPELHVLLGVNAAYKSQDLLHQPGLEYALTGMPDQRTNCALGYCCTMEDIFRDEIS